MAVAQSVKQNLLAAFRYLLKPLVRLALKNGVGFPEFSEALKQAYVIVANRELRAAGGAPTDERISVNTSIEKGDVTNILRAAQDAHFRDEVQAPSPLPTLLAAWHTDQNCTGPYGVLRDLPFSSAEVSGDLASYTFTRLVADYCPGVSADALRDELVATGCLTDVGNGYLRALKRSYIPDPLSPASIRLVARVVHNICETLETNLRAKTPADRRLVERTIYTVHGVTPEDLNLFDRFIRERGQIFADDIDNWFSERDTAGSPNLIRTGVGFYHYIVNEEDESALAVEMPNEGLN